uniref:proliferation marker protein Ki-67 isoform X2 n=1 Tax=Doryrhamphus excisus TaxID=161450 RepID=UPI0025AE5913|nr:proliferation marker protein Ki-67 isoform X2 [Doryrhamphus excisus]
MPLHGKIVVIKRSGGDGTEFPLTASCLFGRKPDCDIRIQVAQVSKEHCRIDLNENKEVILTNLSSVNPTRVNGEALQQSERLKHGDVITIVDRSFRFEYPPGPTPKKFAKEGKTETPKPHLQDGTNHNIQRSLEDPMEAGDMEPSKTMSPFSDLYQMIRKSLDVKTPQKSSGNNVQMPTSKNKEHVSAKGTPKMCKAGAEGETEDVIPKSDKKRRHSSQSLASDAAATPVKGAENVNSEAASPQTRLRTTPQRFPANEVVKQVCTPTPKSPMRRRSKDATPAKDQEEVMQSPDTDSTGVTENDPKTYGSADLVNKKKRVSFGGYLVPELFDKKLPPDSPLRKGDTPRRSLCLAKPKQSLLRRASVIGCENVAVIGSPKGSGKKSPKGKSPSPGKKTQKLSTPSPVKKSPKSTPASAKGHSPGKKSPKSKTPSPKMPKSAPVSPKGASPRKKSPKPITPSAKTSPPKSRSSSPKATGRISLKSNTPRRASSLSNKLATPATKKRTSHRPTPEENVIKTPLSSQMQISSVQGRFSVSRIKTPSPIAEDGVRTPSPTVTPKIPLRRKSMKSTSRKTPRLAKSAARVVLRRSGISRASMKVMSAWADKVKFGKAKVPAVAPAKNVMKSTSKALKVTHVSKLQTPVRKPLSHTSTGHANSPATITVGRAVKQNVTLPVGAAPKVMFTAAVSKKDLKMDEDLTGVSEMFKTPVNERKRRSQQDKSGAKKTPVRAEEPAAPEPSLLNTPEEPGEMMVSPLTAASAVKASTYNREAVKRLLNDDEESSFVCDASTLKPIYNSTEQECIKMKTSSVATPKQKPQPPECLTGVKRIMKTPRQNAEPVEDLRGRLLKTPNQKPVWQECFTGVKRIMKTPKPKNEPVEDLRGRLLKTPKQKHEQQECLTGVKRIMRTPRQKAEAIEDLRGKILKTPKQKYDVADVSFSGLADLLETPAKKSQPEEANAETQKVDVGSSDVKTIVKTPKQRSAPIEDMLGIERLLKTPKERSQPVEENFGIKRLMKSPKPRGNAPVEDFDGLQDLMKEPLSDRIKQPDTAKCEDQTTVSSGLDMEKGDTTKVLAEVPDAKQVICQAVVKEEKPPVTETASTDPAASKKPIRGRRAKTVERKAAADKQEMTEPSQDPAPVRGSRGRKAEPTEHSRDDAEPAQGDVKAAPKRGRGAIKVSQKIEMVQESSAETLPEPESKSIVPPAKSGDAAILEKTAMKPKRGRKPKQESLQSKPDVSQEGNGDDKLELTSMQHNENKLSEVEVAAEKDVTTAQKKSLRGRKGKLVEESRAEHEKQEVACEEAAVSAPIRARRGKRTEATAPPAGQKTTRSKKAKNDSVAQLEIVENMEPVTSADTVNDVTASTSGQDEVNEPAVEPVLRPSRGRKAKYEQAEPLHSVPDKTPDSVTEQAELPAPTGDKPRRGRKLISESSALHELAKDTQQSKPAAKTRGRKTKQETEPQDPVLKSRSSRKGEETFASESEKISQQDPGVVKSKRVGAGKSKKEATNVTSDESTENQDGPIETPAEKPKRGRRAKQVEDVGTTEIPEQKPQRGRGVKTNSKDDISQVIPAKRARRGEEAKKVEALVTVPKSAPVSVEPVKRGRPAAAKASSASNATDRSTDAIAESAQTSQRSVRWKTELEVHEIPKATPVKAVRGRKSKPAEQAEPQPAKRTRRGAKAADEVDSTNKAEETQPKTRRGRSAKK